MAVANPQKRKEKPAQDVLDDQQKIVLLACTALNSSASYVVESWLPPGLLPPVCEAWESFKNEICVRGVERTWVGVVLCAELALDNSPNLRLAKHYCYKNN
eukprot:1160738-Pelagomonas_calceolata.AAC.1